MEAIAKGVLSAVLAYTTHYGATKLYDGFCVPDGIVGYLRGLVSSGSPVCQAGLAIMTSTQVSYSNIISMSISRLVLDLVSPGKSSAT